MVLDPCLAGCSVIPIAVARLVLVPIVVMMPPVAATPFGMPFPVLVALAAWGVTHVLLYCTRFGNYVFAIGGNRDALVLAGVRASLYHIAVYVYMGLVIGVAALLLTGRMNAAHPTVAIGMEFDAIAAVVLGGTSFERGDGRLFGTVAGVAAIAVLRNALDLLGIESSLQVVSIGVLILVVLVVDSVRKRRTIHALRVSAAI